MSGSPSTCVLLVFGLHAGLFHRQTGEAKDQGVRQSGWGGDPQWAYSERGAIIHGYRGHLTLQELVGASAEMVMIDDHLKEWCEKSCPRQNLAGIVIQNGKGPLHLI